MTGPRTAPKRRRAQLAKAEAWAAVALAVGSWVTQLRAADGTGTLPPDQWPPGDPLIDLCTRYGLTHEDLARVLDRVADEAERRAHQAGYDDAWI